ncbi:MAG TPA: hypothetical protein DEB09_02585 [Candidatus Magasanikbacteria bacterium]|nr:hypothetical protein [Candidatus Magasanikbacteria bacterium]
MIKNIPDKKIWVEKNLKKASWSRMGYWEKAGKGYSKVDTSPGASFMLLQIILIYLGIIFLFTETTSTKGIILIVTGIFFGLLKNHSRRKFLEKKYYEYYHVINKNDS